MTDELKAKIDSIQQKLGFDSSLYEPATKQYYDELWDEFREINNKKRSRIKTIIRVLTRTYS